MASKTMNSKAIVAPAGAAHSPFVAGKRCAARRSAAPRSRRELTRCVQTAPASTESSASAGSGKTAVVVGAGVGGLAMAGRLARAGYKVQLLEKNDLVGGRCQSYTPPEAEGYRWDTGPSLLLMPSKYRDAFEALGENFDDHVEIRRVEPTAVRCHYGDHSNMDLLYDMEKMREQLEEEEKGAGGKYFRFLGAARASYDLGLKAFIEQVSFP